MPTRRLKLITQEDDYGCAVACMAMVLGRLVAGWLHLSRSIGIHAVRRVTQNAVNATP